jgi:hypothetical protein
MTNSQLPLGAPARTRAGETPKGHGSTLCVSLAVLFLAVSGFGRPKTDVVILKNGDHITGEIREVTRGMLTLKTDSLGTVSIKWQDVAKISSAYEFKVEDTAGQRHIGTIATVDGTDRLEVTGAGFKSDVALPEIVVMTQADESLWRRFDGSFDAGYSFTKSSVRSQFNLDSDIRYHGSHWEAEATYSSILGSSEGTVDTNRNVVTVKGDRFLGNKWHAIGVGQYEQNAELALDRRISAGGAAAWRFVQNNRALASVSSGLTFTREAYTSEPEHSNLEALLGSSFQIFKYYSPKVDVTLNYSLLPNLTTWGRVRSEFNTKANIEIVKNFFFSLSIYDSFDNEPPAKNPTKNDYGVVTSLGWTFRR